LRGSFGVNIEIVKEDLLRALGTVSGVVERRQTLPILANVLIESAEGRLRLRATDLELAISTDLPGTASDVGAVTLPARKLMDFCRSLSDGATVKVRMEAERCVVSSGRTRFTLGSLPAGDFPSVLPEADLRSTNLPAGQLKTLLDKTHFAMAQQDVRYYLNGVLLEFSGTEITAVATDGHRLARYVVVADGSGIDETRQIIIPAKSVGELRRLLADESGSVDFRWGERTFVLFSGETALTSKLLEGKYPEYRRVIPRGLDKEVVLDREGLRLALQRAAILSNEKYKGVKVTFESGVVRLQAQNPEHESSEDELVAAYEGDPVTVGFNIGYLMDVLQSVGQASLSISLQDADSSSVWRGVGCDDETFVVMPMRL
jgi:DNA polymerase III subunit beta